MARPRGARRISKSDERESCINVSGLLVEQILLRTIMGIRAHPGSLGERPRRAILAPSLVVASGRPFVHLFIPSRRPRWGSYRYLMYSVSVLGSIFLVLEGPGEAIPSEPPSLAHPMWLGSGRSMPLAQTRCYARV